MNHNHIIGIDEVGRGCVAGPVFVAGVKLTQDFPVETFPTNPHQDYSGFDEYMIVRDSKKLSQKRRDMVRNLILRDSLPYSLLKASAKLIDEYGIGSIISHLSALIIESLGFESCRIIIDGKVKLLSEYNHSLLFALIEENQLNYTIPVLLSSLPIERESLADDRYLSIALASCIAKVSRDHYMSEIGKSFPEYEWHQNKGYGTQKHLEAIMKNPKNPLLRQTFLTNYIHQN